jgi:ectoine hydroxylase-related dioxygenase (phytanoyl-CoA dioxygenase family)
MVAIIEGLQATNANYRCDGQIFAIRNFLQEVPAIVPLITNSQLHALLTEMGCSGYYAVRSIYFNKPPVANWLVPWHQDLTISVQQRASVPGYTGWTSKHGYLSVCPPVQVLSGIVTIRIHLDDATEANGALQVLPGSHLQGVVRKDNEMNTTHSQLVPVPAGGVMLMRPLLFHSSHRTENNAHRRVIHIELSDVLLPHPLQWAERVGLF